MILFWALAFRLQVISLTAMVDTDNLPGVGSAPIMGMAHILMDLVHTIIITDIMVEGIMAVVITARDMVGFTMLLQEEQI